MADDYSFARRAGRAFGRLPGQFQEAQRSASAAVGGPAAEAARTAVRAPFDFYEGVLDEPEYYQPTPPPAAAAPPAQPQRVSAYDLGMEPEYLSPDRQPPVPYRPGFKPQPAAAPPPPQRETDLDMEMYEPQYLSYSVGGGPTQTFRPGQEPKRGGFASFDIDDVAFKPESYYEDLALEAQASRNQHAIRDPLNLELQRAMFEMDIAKRTASERAKQGGEREVQAAQQQLINEFADDVARMQAEVRSGQRSADDYAQTVEAERQRLALLLQSLGGGRDYVSALLPKPGQF